jgi:hypothetical protein
MNRLVHGSAWLYGKLLLLYPLDLRVEGALEHHAVRAILFFAVAAMALALAWRRHPAPGGVRFDGSQPVIQSLELN